MAEIGVSRAELVEPREDTARKLPQYIAAIAGKSSQHSRWLRNLNSRKLVKLRTD